MLWGLCDGYVIGEKIEMILFGSNSHRLQKKQGPVLYAGLLREYFINQAILQWI